MPNSLFFSVVVALLLTAFTFAAETALSPLLGFTLMLRTIIIALTLLFAACLLGVAKRREGRLVVGTTALLASSFSFFLPLGLFEVAMINGSLLLLLQWTLLSRGPLYAMADAAVL